MACNGCEYPIHEQYERYAGRWLCLHPHRDEISNTGTFTFPQNDRPHILICETPAELYGDFAAHNALLAAAPTPKWCYLAIVQAEQERRMRTGEPPFDPDRQREILYGA